MNNNPHDIDKAFVSAYDRFLFEFDATHAKSASQEKERAKHQRIFLLRDNVQENEKQQDVWEGF